jgi:hypothetical protein
MTTTARRRLDLVQPERRTPRIAVCLYGPPGTGKTTAACGAPGPVLVLNAESSTALDFARARYGAQNVREYRVTGRQSLIDVSLYLRDGGDGEQTVVLDPVEDVWRILVEESSPSNRPSLQNFGDAGTTIERFARFLVKDADVNAIFVCHEQLAETADGMLLMPMTGGRKNPQILTAMCDVVGYTAVLSQKEGPPRYVAKVQPDERRYAKNRNGLLAPVVDLDLSAWAKAYAEFARPQKEKKA